MSRLWALLSFRLQATPSLSTIPDGSTVSTMQPIAVHGERYRNLGVVYEKNYGTLLSFWFGVYSCKLARGSFVFLFLCFFFFTKGRPCRPIFLLRVFFFKQVNHPSMDSMHSAIQTEKKECNDSWLEEKNEKKKETGAKKSKTKYKGRHFWNKWRRRLIHHDVDTDGPSDAAHGACRSSSSYSKPYRNWHSPDLCWLYWTYSL